MQLSGAIVKSLILCMSMGLGSVKDRIIKNQAKAVGYVINPSAQDGKKTTLSYLLFKAKDNRMYVSYWATLEGMVVGDKYNVVYDSLYPNDNHVLLDDPVPVFLPGEDTAKTVGYIVSTNAIGCTYSYVHLEDTVKVGYEREQLYPERRRARYVVTIYEGVKYEVTYSVSNPGRAVIDLEKRL